MRNAKDCINNQSGQIIWAVLVGFMVIVGSLFLFQNSALSTKNYARFNKQVRISIIGFSLIEKIKMGLAGHYSDCSAVEVAFLSSKLDQFRKFDDADYENHNWKETNLTVIPDCFISSQDKLLIGSLRLSIQANGKPNFDSLHSSIGIELELFGKKLISSSSGGGAPQYVQDGKFLRILSVNLSVSSLAQFGLIFTKSSDFYDIAPDAEVHVYTKSYFNDTNPLEMGSLLSNNRVKYFSPLFSRATSLKLPAGSTTIDQGFFSDNFKEGIYLNVLNQITGTWFDSTHDSGWNWKMDMSKVYDTDRSYILPIPGMVVRQSSPGASLPLSQMYDPTEANYNIIRNGSGGASANNILKTNDLIYTCYPFADPDNNLLIFQDKTRDLSIDFTNSLIDTTTGAGDKRPILCGLVSVKDLTIKLSGEEKENLLVGFFHIHGKITVTGKGSLVIINPFEQKTLPAQINNDIIKNPAFISNQIEKISIYSNTIGKNFTLPIFKNPGSAPSLFQVLTPSILSTSLLFIENNDCPGPGESLSLCWKSTVTKPDDSTTKAQLFGSGNYQNIIFYIEEVL